MTDTTPQEVMPPYANITPYKIATAGGDLMYVMVIEDMIVTCNQASVVGRPWAAYRKKLTASGAVITTVT